MDAVRYEPPLQAYQNAADVESHPVLHFKRGRVLQALQRFSLALDQFRAFRRKAEPSLLARVPQIDSLITCVALRVTEVTLHCGVQGATVLLRGKEVGRTPLGGAIRANSGPAKLTILAEGHERYEADLKLPGGESLELTVELKKVLSKGVLRVVSPIAGATVFVDGKRLGSVPAEIALVAGDHEILVQHVDYLPSTTRVELCLGDLRFGTGGFVLAPLSARE